MVDCKIDVTSIPPLPPLSSPAYTIAHIGFTPSMHQVSALGLPVYTTSHSPHLPLTAALNGTSLSLPSTSTSLLPVTNPPPLVPHSTSGQLAQSYIQFPGVPSLSPKLASKILAWEYIDLSDLLPEQLRRSVTATAASIVLLQESAYETNHRKKRQIPDIATWVQVYSTYMLVLASKFPDSLPELIAYQLFIVQHSTKFRYPSWLHYDTEFRQWAAANKHAKDMVSDQPSALCPCLYGAGILSELVPGMPDRRWQPHLRLPAAFQPLTWHPISPLPPSGPIPSPAAPTRMPTCLTTSPSPPKRSKPEHCILYNKYNGACLYGDSCISKHRCAH